MVFYCETCGREVSLEEGTLSWAELDQCVGEFRITHKTDQNHSCDPSRVAYIHLWIVTGVTGFAKFIETLAGYWEKGYTLSDAASLKKVINQISMYIWEKTNRQRNPERQA